MLLPTKPRLPMCSCVLVVLLTGGPARVFAQRERTASSRPHADQNPLREPLARHGLDALAERTGWRPSDRFRAGDGFLSERVIYTDTVTGHEVWQMTVDPAVDQVAYYDLPEWNADGSLLRFTSSRAEQSAWIMNADGTRLRPLPLERAGGGYWSTIAPHTWWVGEHDDGGSRVVAFNIRTGERQVVASTRRGRLHLQPPHPREQFFLLARNCGEADDCEVVMLGRDGSERVVPIGGQFHRLRFTKADDLSIFFNRDNPRTQWRILPDGSGRMQLPQAGVHPDWTADGSQLTFFTAEGLMALKPGDQPRRMFRARGGHGGPSLDGDFFIADQGDGGLFPNCIVYAKMDGSGDVRPVAYHGDNLWPHSPASRCHPDHHSTHPHPSFSPDGTKAVFSSYFGRAFTDVHVVICRYPDPPRQLSVRREAHQVVLQWEPPVQHRELRGYAILRRRAGGDRFEQINAELSRECMFRDVASAGGEADYRVAAVEHSGLTSDPAGVGAAMTVSMSAPRRAPPVLKAAPASPTRLEARVVDAFHVELTWAVADDPSVQFYHVYNVTAADSEPSPTMRIASPAAAQARMVDWARTPGSTQHYRVTAVDRFGQESAASPVASVVLPALRIVNIERSVAEADAGSGVELGRSRTGEPVATRRQGGSPPSATLIWKIELPELGEYALWIDQSAVLAAEGRRLSIQWNRQAEIEAAFFGPFDRFTWWPVESTPSATPVVFRLEAGVTTLRLGFLDGRVQVRRILITNDATRMPEEFGGPPVSHLEGRSN